MIPSRSSISLILSYFVDWIVIIGIAAVGGGINKKTPNHRPFSPVDPDISFPFVEHEKVSTATLVVVSLIAPGIITALAALILTPGFHIGKDAPKRAILRRKLWEWNTAWLGLGLGLATTFLFTQGVKKLIGRPRPDLLSRCDLDPATVQQYALGGFGTQLPQFNLLLSSTACRQSDRSKLDDGFQSFPSGHSSFSWSGMFYLALYLCSKFNVSIPYLLPVKYPGGKWLSARGSYREISPTNAADSGFVPARSQAAAPPAYLWILPLFPIAVATYVASTRFSDFRHHGFDIIFGAVMGATFSFTSFRIYHLPIRRGAGWSWGPRAADKAWFIRVGTPNYADEAPESRSEDVELGNISNGMDNKDSSERPNGSSSPS